MHALVGVGVPHAHLPADVRVFVRVGGRRRREFSVMFTVVDDWHRYLSCVWKSSLLFSSLTHTASRHEGRREDTTRTQKLRNHRLSLEFQLRSQGIGFGLLTSQEQHPRPTGVYRCGQPQRLAGVLERAGGE